MTPEFEHCVPAVSADFKNNTRTRRLPTRIYSEQSLPSSNFITLKLKAPVVETPEFCLQPAGHESTYFEEFKIDRRERLEEIMKTRNAWSRNLANPNVQKTFQDEEAKELNQALDTLQLAPNASSTRTIGTPNRRGILKRGNASPASPNPTSANCQPKSSRQRAKKVSLNLHAPTIHHYHHETDATDNDPGSFEVDSPGWQLEEKEVTQINKRNMPQSGSRPSLKLKLSTVNLNTQPPPATAQTPNPQSAVRTPSIKLSFGKKPSISGGVGTIIKKDVQDEATPSSGKKRKRTKVEQGSEDELNKHPPPQRRLTLKTSAVPAKTPVTPGPVFRLKTKGKIPKRPLGVGYDSELEDRETDPVLLEGLILRMPPGPDCDYVQTAIRDGTIGIHRSQGGPDIRIRCIDTNGRRGIMFVNGHQYATTVVDLPCIVEGLKSWDKKGWIKSIDICQMMLVLGTCVSDEEAKNYPLPEDVDPKTFAYAHGLTAPMKWVRKRRFARTRRARVDDIESIERKVNALLEADIKAISSSYQIFDHDPRIEQDQYSEVEGDYDDEDAEGEEDDSYFPRQIVETPGGMELDAHVDQDQIDDIEAMFNEDDDDGAGVVVNGHSAPKVGHNTLHPPTREARDSSVAITSASASPSASAGITAAATPAEAHAASSDDDDDDDEDASDRSDSEKDADDNLQQVKDRIVDMESKIREQTELLRRTPNAILKKKLAKKIGELKDDVRMMKVQNGLVAEGDGDDGDD